METIIPRNKRTLYKIYPKSNAVQSWKDPTGMMMMNGSNTEIEMILNVLKYASSCTNIQNKEVTHSGFATLDGITFYMILSNNLMYAFDVKDLQVSCEYLFIIYR
jgi:hypothetical protein